MPERTAEMYIHPRIYRRPEQINVREKDAQCKEDVWIDRKEINEKLAQHRGRGAEIKESQEGLFFIVIR